MSGEQALQKNGDIEKGPEAPPQYTVVEDNNDSQQAQPSAGSSLNVNEAERRQRFIKAMTKEISALTDMGTSENPPTMRRGCC